MNKIKKPKVSVCIVAYNQKEFIGQCLNSLVNQEINFEFEIIISDDCSSDGTSDIIKEITSLNPNIIRSFRHEKNIGAFDNFRFAHQQAKGEYIAHMDGDDYALPGKLQMQADYLDMNPNCNISFHRVIVVGVEAEPVLPANELVISNFKFYRRDIINLVSIGANSSKMYRVSAEAIDLPEFDLVDYAVNVIHVGNGYAAYCGEKPLGVYRKGLGISGNKKVIKAVLETLIYFKKKYPEYMCEINSSTLGWLASNIKNKRPFIFEFLKLAITTFSICGLVKFIEKRFFSSEIK